MSDVQGGGLFATPGGEAPRRPVHAAGDGEGRAVPASPYAGPPAAGASAYGPQRQGVPASPYGPPVHGAFVPAPSAPGPSPTGQATVRDAAQGAPGGAAGMGGSSWPGAPLTTTRRAQRRGRTLAAGISLAVVGIVAGGTGAYVGQQLPASRPVVNVVVASPAAEPAGRPAGSVADVAARVTPSVVSLEVKGTDAESTGSGFVFSEDGFVVTNYHVVELAVTAGKAGRVVVVLADGTQLDGEVVGSTASYDLAVVKVDAEGLVPLVLGDSDALVVGDPVTAFGAPLGLAGTVTTGIVSALNRPVVAGGANDAAFINAVQTDASINPGNSGGPLVSSAGEVVGINSAIAQPPGVARAAGSIGLGFAIPSNQALRTVTQLIETGSATYPIIGVLLDRTYTGQGVRVMEQAQGDQQPVTPDGPAAKAGIRPGDVIVAIDGRPVTRPDDLIVAIRAHAPGDVVTLTLREGEDGERTVRMVLDEVTSS